MEKKDKKGFLPWIIPLSMAREVNKWLFGCSVL